MFSLLLIQTSCEDLQNISLQLFERGGRLFYLMSVLPWSCRWGDWGRRGLHITQGTSEGSRVTQYWHCTARNSGLAVTLRLFCDITKSNIFIYSAICPLQLCMCGATSLETLYRLWICILVAYEQWADGTSEGEDDATFWPWTSRLQSVFGPAPALDAGKWSQKWAAWACSWGLAWEAAGDNAARHSVANSGLAAKHQSHSVPFCI